jgi:prevent-host-death family protein
MLTVKEKATIVGVAELRKVMKDVLEEIKTNTVILTRRNKPIGVLVDYDKFKRMEDSIEMIEDYVLGRLAEERAGRKDKKLITLEDVEKKLGLR